MANSKRHLIVDQVLSALTAITVAGGYQTDVAHVSESIKHWEEIDQDNFPACFPIDGDAMREPRVIFESAGDDMRSVLTVIVTSMVFSSTNDTRLARTNLMRDVEKALVTHAGLIALIHDINPGRIVTDRGTIVNYSVWDQEFEIEYFYPHADGG